MGSSLWRLAAAGAFLAACCAGQSGTSPTGTDKTATVVGQVNHALTGEPMVRAHITLGGNAGGERKQYGAMTNAEGKFSITGIAPGSYQLMAEKVGFTMPPGGSSRVSLLLRESEKKDAQQLRLLPTGAIVGKVTDAEGEPVEGANVSTEGGMTEFAMSDEKGQFRLGGLAPGKYRVKAILYTGMPFAPEIRTDGTEEPHYATTYSPGVLNAKEAVRVEVRPNGESGGADIRLLRVPWIRVSGRVAGLPEGMERASITARRAVAGFSPGGSARVRPDGSFEIWRLDPGQYLISASWVGPGNQYQTTAPHEIEVAASNIDGVELRVVPESDIPGRLEFEDDAAKQLVTQPRPAPAGPQRATQGSAPNGQQARPRLLLLLRDVTTGAMPGGPVPVDEAGTFLAKKVAAGRYRVTLQPDFVYIKSMRLGSQGIEGSILDLNNGSAGAELSLLVSAATGSVSGAVIDDRGSAAGARVALRSVGSGEPGSQRFATADQDGKYQILNLAPGSYQLVAVADSDSDVVMQRSGLDEYEDLMETLEIHPGDKISKDLKRRTPGER